MYYTGIDLHKRTCFITSIDKKGETVTKANLHNVEEAILTYFQNLQEETKIVIESTASWYWLYDTLTGNGFDVVISNPVKVKALLLLRSKVTR